MKDTLLGRIVHFPDRSGTIFQGEIVVALMDKAEGDIQITVLCGDRKFRTAYLSNCTDGAAPKPEDEEKRERPKR